MKLEERITLLDIPEELLIYATEQELALYRRALEIEARLDGILSYMQFVSPATKAFPHVRLICSYVDALIAGNLYYDGPGPEPVPADEVEIDPDTGEELVVMVHPERGDRVVYNLLLHAPPRHGKSFIISEHLPAYLLTKFPDLSGILATYEQTFSERWGGLIRDHIADNEKEFGINVSGGRNAAKGEFRMKGHRGEFKAAGAGGSITGRGGQWIIADDLISNAEDARSETILKGHEDWWHSTFYNRRQGWPDGTPGRCLGIWTRWTENDIRGRVIDQQREKWCVLNLPAIAETTDDEPVDPLGREPGAALCPPLVPRRELEDLRNSSENGRLWFECMYQGRPYITEGNLIKKPFQHYSMDQDADGHPVYVLHFLDGRTLRVPEDQTMLFAALDLAASIKTSADWTVLGLFVVTKTQPRYLLVRGMERTRITTENHAPFLQRMHSIWKFKYALIEQSTYGTNLIGIMQKQNKVQIRPVTADKDKFTRASGTVVPALDMRQLFFPNASEAEWYAEFEREILRFPNATHDDQVDVLSYACQEFHSIPLYQIKKDYAPGMQGIVQRHFEALRKGKKHGKHFHPELGRWR